MKVSKEAILTQLSEVNYYSKEANENWWSVSQYKSLTKCEAAAMARLRWEYEPPITRALLVGTFVDAYFDGTLDHFQKEHPSIFTRKNELRAEFRKANEIINRVKTDERFMEFMSGEKQKILTAEMFDVNWKIKMDSFVEGKCIVDLKTAANFQTLPRFRYDLQGAVYQAVCEANGYGRLPFFLAVATKERVPDFDIFQIPQSVLDLALREIGENMPHFIAVKEGLEEPHACGVCDYCKSVKKARIRNYIELLEG